MTLLELLASTDRRIAVFDADRELKRIGGQISGARRRKDFEAAAHLEQLRDAARERLSQAKEKAAA
jgi:hypothetical protein